MRNISFVSLKLRFIDFKPSKQLNIDVKCSKMLKRNGGTDKQHEMEMQRQKLSTRNTAPAIHCRIQLIFPRNGRTFSLFFFPLHPPTRLYRSPLAARSPLSIVTSQMLIVRFKHAQWILNEIQGNVIYEDSLGTLQILTVYGGNG